jgi:hypothetical protein
MRLHSAGYSFTGSFESPDSFTLALSSGGSGPAGVERFVGRGTLHTVQASEPTIMLPIGSALAGAAWGPRATAHPGRLSRRARLSQTPWTLTPSHRAPVFSPGPMIRQALTRATQTVAAIGNSRRTPGCSRM